MKELEKKVQFYESESLRTRFRKGTDCCRPMCGHESDMENNQNFFSKAEHVVWKVDHMMAVYKSLNLIPLCFDHQQQKDSIFTYQVGLNLDV